ncbi:YbaB/EbfC family nucleoid-associated protein [Desulforudis sp. 1088]|uniref:YbaB/EbfC family nucleoid-associated protein n=1 Tax=unclassified Candidatus Desulforudis TaxID=2635950 RepID=UPI00346DBBD3
MFGNLGGLLGIWPGIREALASIVVEASNDLVRVTMDGQQKVLQVKLAEDAGKDPAALEDALAECFDRVIVDARVKAKAQLERQLGFKLPF